MVVSRGGTPVNSGKKSHISCWKFTRRFRCEIITPAGMRVEPEVYCKYAVLGALLIRMLDELSAARSSESTSMIAGTVAMFGCWTYYVQVPATSDIVSMTIG